MSLSGVYPKMQQSSSLLTFLCLVDHPQANGDIPTDGIPSAEAYAVPRVIYLLIHTKKLIVFFIKYRSQN